MSSSKKPRDGYCVLSCGCLDTMYGALKEIGAKKWEQCCWWHGWQTVEKELSDHDAAEFHYRRNIRHKQNTLF